MATETLEDAFLADLYELSDAEDVNEHSAEEQDEMKEEDEFGADLDTLKYDDLRSVAKLTTTERYRTIMQRINDMLEAKDMDTEDDRVWTGSADEDPTYRLLVDCNRLAVDIDNEIVVVHNFIRDKYRPKFPELESLVHHPVDYARVVQRIGNEEDVTQIQLDDILPAATVMVVSVTATTTNGKKLSQDELNKVLEGCQEALQLDEDKSLILKFVESKMHNIAPNLSTALGSEVAARLMGLAGGLVQLSQIPACNIQVLGAKRKIAAGFSTAHVGPHQGYIYGAELMQHTPPALRVKMARMLANKVALLARFDAYGKDAAGSTGATFKEEMLKKLEKWQEPPPAKQPKPLPKPDAEAKKRRGGRRLRKQKERYATTELHKAANRMNFNQPEDEFIDGDEVVGLGVLGKDSGRLRIVAAQSKLKMSKKAQQKVRKLGGATPGAATSGTATSLSFTPMQGFDLENPNAKVPELDRPSGTESYFSDFSGFRSIAK